MTSTLLVGILLGLLVGLLAGLGAGTRATLRARTELAATEHARAEAARHAADRESALREELAWAQASAPSEAQTLDAFRSVANQAVGESLTSLGDRLAALERERVASSSALEAVVGELAQANRATQAEAAKLAAALRDSRVRGAWGEVQLRRVLELAGLARHADFVEQRSVRDGESFARPDVVVPLANGRCVVIDAKAPLDRFLDAANASNAGDLDAERRFQVLHAKAVAAHVQALASRDYVAKVDGAVDMVLLFLPGEPFLAAALDADPTLWESAAARGVTLVTPSSLLGVLRGIALGWREHQAEQAAAEIHQLGTELHDRIAVFAEHHASVGAQLDKAVAAYNASVGSLDTRVLSTARKLADHGASSLRPLPEPGEVTTAARPLRVLAAVTDPPAVEPRAPEPPSMFQLGS